MKTPELAAISDQSSASPLSASGDDRVDVTPAQSSYDFFGNSELLIAES
jgi:hypothetical protein